MKVIGLIGGMSWESTAVYYRLINEAVRRQCGGLHSAEIAMRSLDFVSVVELQQAGKWDEAGRLLGEAGAGLARAGAGIAMLPTYLTAQLVHGGELVPLFPDFEPQVVGRPRVASTSLTATGTPSSGSRTLFTSAPTRRPEPAARTTIAARARFTGAGGPVGSGRRRRARRAPAAACGRHRGRR